MTIPAGETVRIDEILDDDTYRISRRIRNDALELSLRNLGMLEVPVLVRGDKGLVPFTCHNRISAMRKIGVSMLQVNIITGPDYGIFYKNTALKAGRGELGPTGKARALIIAGECFGISDSKAFCRNVLNASGDILTPGFAAGILDLPAELADYIDSKDIGFRVIRDILMLPPRVIHILSGWVGTIQLRVNIFKMLVDCLFDMRDTVSYEKLPLFDDEDKADDRTLFNIIYRMRYPRYSEMKDKAAGLISSVSSPGIAVEFPEYFERDSCVIRIDIKSSDTAAEIGNKLSRIDTAGLERLVSLLK